ncbi:hypothetical protein HJC23_002038 [Cyclotella cryptica]|uniref:Cyclin-like domain-containing protein n=1 Tax=Cyclotella cryptica TaxID=29204 RepID=A0ABD3Q7T0_9STRA|eukprot:CCRYP_008267-RA/>CCRYP_008267-RA protein AED:0.00 eAED:0.00 QI:0/-1/0/1/-1/1/1/0/325
MSALDMIISSEEGVPLTGNLSVEEITDRLHVMQRQESTFYKCRDYIDGTEATVDRECRVKMCEWCYQVTDFCKFKRETVAVSMSYLDRFLSKSRPSARRALKYKKDYQLAAMTCLYIAIKLFEPLAMDTGLLSSISQGCYTESDISEMEQEILTSLGWRMNGPTPQDFLSHIIDLLPSSVYTYDESIPVTLSDFSRFQIELAVSDYDLSLHKPSVLALASILNSAAGVDDRMFPTQSRLEYLQFISTELRMNPFSTEVKEVRARLLNLFARNSGYEMPQIATPIVCTDIERHYVRGSRKPAANSSPVSVARSFYPEPDRYHARCA